MIGSEALVMAGNEERWVVVRVQGYKWHLDGGGQHWSCMEWT